MKIATIGLAKSGTTAIYEAIKSSLPNVEKTLFEPKTPTEMDYLLNGTETGVTKIMFTKRGECEYDPNKFDKNIFIVRDPRDVFVSSLLYRFNTSSFSQDEKRYTKLLQKFVSKENNPDQVSVLSILEEITKNEPLRIFHAHATMLSEMIHFSKQHTNLHILRYEDFVDGRLDDLSKYLGSQVQNQVELTGWTSKIQRKGVYGDWKNWFTPNDIQFFKPAMEYFLEYFDYGDDWEILGDPKIYPKYCSVYIKRLVSEHQNDPMSHKKEITKESIENLYSAADDGKHIAMVQLANMYKTGNELIKKDNDKALSFFQKASELGNINALYQVGKILLDKKESNQALSYFKRAMDAGHPNSAYETGVLYEKGLGSEKDAFRAYLKGAELGSKSCMRKVANCFKKGLGTTIDLEKFKSWNNKYKNI